MSSDYYIDHIDYIDHIISVILLLIMKEILFSIISILLTNSFLGKYWTF